MALNDPNQIQNPEDIEFGNHTKKDVRQVEGGQADAGKVGAAAALGSAVSGVVPGMAAMGALSAGANLIANELSPDVRQRRKYIRDQFGKLRAGQSLVSDRERARMQEQIQGTAQRQLGMQQQQLNQMAQASGSFAKQQLQAATGDMGKQAQEATIQAGAQQQQMEAQLHAQRAANVREMQKELVGNAGQIRQTITNGIGFIDKIWGGG